MIKKEFNKPERAEELKLGIIQAGERSVIKIDIKDIPDGYTVDDFLALIKEEGIALVDAPRQKNKYYSLYAMGETLVDNKGRKIYIIDTLEDQGQYKFSYLDEPSEIFYEDFRVIDTHFCLDVSYMFHLKYASLVGDAREKK